MLFVVSRSLHLGRLAGIAAVIGGQGVYVQVTAVALRDGFVVGLTNPKAIVFFAAVLPQFADRRAGHVPLQLLLLGAIFIAIALISDTMWAVAAGSARAWR